MGSEFLIAVGRPPLDDRGIDLRVELEAEAAAQPKRLRRVRGAGYLGRTIRHREAVDVPRHPRSWRDQVGEVGLDLDPADLGLRRPRHFGAEGRGQHLTAEADAEHGNTDVDRAAQGVELGSQRLTRSRANRPTTPSQGR